MNEQKEKPVTGASSNGTVIKPFLIEGGRFVVAVDMTEGSGGKLTPEMFQRYLKQQKCFYKNVLATMNI